MKFKFSHEIHADEETQREIYRKLKLASRLGKMADKAIRDLEEKGFTERSVPLIKKQGKWGDWGVSMVKLPEAPPITRGLISKIDISDVGFTFGKIKNDCHGGTDFRSAQVWVNCQRLMQKNGNLKKEKVTGVAFGSVRILKNRLSWESKNGTVHNFYTEFKWPKAIEFVEDMAENLAAIMVDYPSQDMATYVTWNLRTKVAEWLVEDGIVQSFIRRMKSEAKILEVMEQ